jgi:membrane-bound lytic murein transglycosylase B
MGQVQFMPSVYLHNAVDFDQDGRIDIRGSTADALASAANYLGKLGWKSGWNWGREVRLPPDFDPELDGLEIQLRLDDWRKLGVRQESGAELPRAAIRASLIRPDGPAGRAFLVYDNYRKLLNWNRSHKFAIAVGLLADRIGQP